MGKRKIGNDQKVPQGQQPQATGDGEVASGTPPKAAGGVAVRETGVASLASTDTAGPLAAGPEPLVAPSIRQAMALDLDGLAQDVGRRMRSSATPGLRALAATLVVATGVLVSSCSSDEPSEADIDPRDVLEVTPQDAAALDKEVSEGLPSVPGEYDLVAGTILRDAQGVFSFAWKNRDTGQEIQARASDVQLQEGDSERLICRMNHPPVLMLTKNSSVHIIEKGDAQQISKEAQAARMSQGSGGTSGTSDEFGGGAHHHHDATSGFWTGYWMGHMMAPSHVYYGYRPAYAWTPFHTTVYVGSSTTYRDAPRYIAPPPATGTRIGGTLSGVGATSVTKPTLEERRMPGLAHTTSRTFGGKGYRPSGGSVIRSSDGITKYVRPGAVSSSGSAFSRGGSGVSSGSDGARFRGDSGTRYSSQS